jgi:mediator of RNA polymerase II transcription subunit 24
LDFQAFPIRLPADANTLTDAIFQQTLIGISVNKLLLSYLKHSLYSQLISYPAVIKRTTEYSKFDRYFCIKSLLDFLSSIIGGVACRSKAEESALIVALTSLVSWLIELVEKIVLSKADANNLVVKGEMTLNTQEAH